MNITYIANSRMPTEKAHGRQIVNMCDAFSSFGNAVNLVLPKRKNDIKKDLFDYYNTSRDFSVTYLDSFDFFKFEKFLGRLSFYFQTIFFLIRLWFLPVPTSAIVYTRNPEIAWLFSNRGYTVAYECHDWFKKSKKLSLFLLRNVRHIISTNVYIKNEFTASGFNEKLMIVSPNGVDMEIFDLNLSKDEAISKLNVDDSLKKILREKKVLLYTGSFKTMGVEKGISDILLALQKIKREDMLFVAIGGSNKDCAYYKNLAEEIGVSENVRILGRQDQSTLAVFQKSSDVLLMPFPKLAHYEFHMAPLKMFEYMASKRPIIASSLPSIMEVLNDKNCLFVHPGDAGDLTEKIQFILNNPDVGEKISEEAYLNVQKYSWKNRAATILEHLQ